MIITHYLEIQITNILFCSRDFKYLLKIIVKHFFNVVTSYMLNILPLFLSILSLYVVELVQGCDLFL